MQLRLLSLAGLAAAAVTLSASAHHSHGAYAMTEYTQIEGTVTDLYWINPHAWIYLEVLDGNGQSAVWALESAGATTLVAGGVNRDDVRVGDRISVRCHQLRDGSPGCLLGFVTTADGVEKEWD